MTLRLSLYDWKRNLTLGSVTRTVHPAAAGSVAAPGGFQQVHFNLTAGAGGAACDAVIS